MFELSSLFFCFLLTVSNGQDIAQEIQRVQNIMNNPNSNSNPNSNNGNTGNTNMPSDAATIFAMDRSQDTDKNYYQKQGYGDREYEYKSGNGNAYNNYGFNNYNQNFDGGNNQSIIRPCYDLSCVRKYFADHSRCKPVYGQVPEPYYRPQANYLLSFFNLTVTSTGIHYRGLQGVIQDF
ncbi:hypothetical protein JYU34_010029 [Plutella xylostella]|uniref:Uncharacterized protein n=1 Tax=Plutella xylostella TaxID=51655 RepID=A0ABQ7QID2_PLUXY|nr:hypothetical protein JYU34_010029 [Plutella xylostella]